MTARIYDSHSFMSTITVRKSNTQSCRDFERQCYDLYLEMCHKWDGYNGSGNTVYLSYSLLDEPASRT